MPDGRASLAASSKGGKTGRADDAGRGCGLSQTAGGVRMVLP